MAEKQKTDKQKTDKQKPDKGEDKSGEEPVTEDAEKKEPKVEWSPENEKILVEWCDIAKCYKWLHTRAHQDYSRKHAWFTIPAIIMSTISGTASFAQGSLPVSMQTYAPMVIGSVNIFIGILTTIQQYLKISEYNESHRVSAIAWDKFARNIRIELAKHPDERSSEAGHFLKTNRDEFDRLMETSPSIPIPIVDEFLEIFSGEEVQKWYKCFSKKKKNDHKIKKQEELKARAEMFEKLKKPDVCNIIVTSDDDRHPWYKDPNALRKKDDVIYSVVSQKITKMQEEMLKKQDEIREEYEEQIRTEKEERERDEQEKIRKQNIQQKFMNGTVAIATKIREQNRQIDDYVRLFSTNHGRKPLKDEINTSLNAKLDNDILNKYLDRYDTDYVDVEIQEDDSMV
jgi:hypothetical protein